MTRRDPFERRNGSQQTAQGFSGFNGGTSAPSGGAPGGAGLVGFQVPQTGSVTDFQFGEMFGGSGYTTGRIDLNVPLSMTRRKLYVYIFLVGFNFSTTYTEISTSIELYAHNFSVGRLPIRFAHNNDAGAGDPPGAPFSIPAFADNASGQIKDDSLLLTLFNVINTTNYPTLPANSPTETSAKVFINPIELECEIDRIVVNPGYYKNLFLARLFLGCLST